MTMTTAKGYKVTDAERKTRVGIAVKNFEELKKKTIDKFKLQHGDINFQTPDGTRVDGDEYFQTLPAQTLLIWVKRGERAETDAELLYKTIREVNEEYLSAGEKVQEFFTEKMKSKVFKLAEVLKGIDSDKVKLSGREEHPEWFEGLDTRAKSKEDYLFRRAQDRIRTYYYKTREDLLKHPREQLQNDQLNRLLNDLQNKLKINKYHGYLFDRRAANARGGNLKQQLSSLCNESGVFDRRAANARGENLKQLPPSLCNESGVFDRRAANARGGNLKQQLPSPLCDESGLFVCMGRWDKDKCLYAPAHRINPYASREERIVFQTWNLDHQIERARGIVPEIREALKGESEEEGCLDVKRIYNHLFTPENLKFVHIVCHDKGAHSGKKAGSYLVF